MKATEDPIVVTVATGGVGSSDQARRYSDVGFDGVCVGRALMLHPDRVPEYDTTDADTGYAKHDERATSMSRPASMQCA